MNTHDSPTRHISDDLLFEYLDHELPDTQLIEIDTHLENCQTCEHRLAEFRSLFSSLDEMPEADLERDLTPGILANLEIGAAPSPVWWWVLVIQGILALGLIAITTPIIVDQPLTFSLIDSGSEILTELSTNISIEFQTWGSLIAQLKQQTIQLFSMRGQISTHFSMTSILWLFLFVTITWIVGNSLLLRPQFKRSTQ